MEAEPMRVLQFAKRSVVTVALICVTLAGCGGESTPDAPFNPAGTSADLAAMDSTFGSSTFASFSTFSLFFDATLGGAPIVSSSVAALDIRGKTPAQMRAAAMRSAQRIAAMVRKPAADGFSASMMTIPSAVAGKTFAYNPSTSAYEDSGLPLLSLDKVRFLLYAVNPVTFEPVVPLIETGYVELTDMSAGSTQAARVVVVSDGTTYIDYTVSATSTVSSGRVTVIGYVTDGVRQANINLRSTISFTAGLTLTYALDLPQRDVAIDLGVNITDLSSPSGAYTINLVMSGPNGTVTMSGTFSGTTGTINVRISGHAFATITADGTTMTITRNDGTPLTEDEFQALSKVFDMSGTAFIAFDQMLAPVGAFFDQPTP
jgi:hypothetical protein